MPERDEIEPRSADLLEYGRSLQHEALLDGTTAFIVHAHAVKMSVASTEEALHLGDTRPLDATARFMAAPKLEPMSPMRLAITSSRPCMKVMAFFVSSTCSRQLM